MRGENGVLVVGHVEHIVAEDDRLFGAGVRVFLPLDFRRLLVGRRVQVGFPTVNLSLERLVLAGEQVGLPVGQRVEFDPHRGRNVPLHTYSPACASMYSSMTSLDTSPALETKYERVHNDGRPKSNSSRSRREE